MENLLFLSITGDILKGVADFLIPIVGIVFIAILVGGSFQVKNGNASMKNVLISAAAVLLIGGSIAFAANNFKNTSSGTNTAVKSAVDKAAKGAAKGAGGVVSGNGK